MLTRSGFSADHSSTSTNYANSKALPPVPVTRSRKRKSNVLQDEALLSRISAASSTSTSLAAQRRTRHSLGGGGLHHLANLFPSTEEKVERKLSLAQGGRRARHSEGVSSSRDFRRRLVNEHDYDTRSSVSTSSSSVVSSHVSSTTRRSSRKNHSDEESVLSCLSVDESLSGKSTPPAYKGLKPTREYEDDRFDEKNSVRVSPLPPVCFANCDEIWELMCSLDIKYHKSPAMFKNHPILSPQMRSILLDWIMDVCEAYHLHRETLYLAIDYLDRYLASQENILKKHLQLLGITCLFVAAKLEEIYPPKLKTFAYVTDGACTEGEILDMELVLMKALKWKLTPITPVNWVNVYLQVLCYRNGGVYCTRSGSDFLRTSIRLNQDTKPQDTKLVKHLYEGIDLVKALRIVDLATLDVASLNFTYSTLAAAAIYHTKGRTAALMASGMKWGQLGPCVNWMAPFASVMRRDKMATVLPSIENVAEESRHLVQSHCVTMEMLEEAQALAGGNKLCSPLNGNTEGLLTPPRSSEKYRRAFE